MDLMNNLFKTQEINSKKNLIEKYIEKLSLSDQAEIIKIYLNNKKNCGLSSEDIFKQTMQVQNYITFSYQDVLDNNEINIIHEQLAQYTIYMIIKEAYAYSIMRIKYTFKTLGIDSNLVNEYCSIYDVNKPIIDMYENSKKTFVEFGPPENLLNYDSLFDKDFYAVYDKKYNLIYYNENKILDTYEMYLTENCEDEDKINRNRIISSIAKSLIHEIIHKFRIHNIENKVCCLENQKENGIDEIITEVLAIIILYVDEDKLNAIECAKKISENKYNHYQQDLVEGASLIKNNPELLKWFLTPRNKDNYQDKFIEIFKDNYEERMEYYNKLYDKYLFGSNKDSINSAPKKN